VAVNVEAVLSSGLADRGRSDILENVRREILRRNILLKVALRDGDGLLEVSAFEDIEEGDLIAQAHSGGIWSAA